MNSFDDCCDALTQVRAQLRRVEDLLLSHNPELQKVAHTRQGERVQAINRIVAEHFEIAVAWLAARARGKEGISWPRQIAMAFAREFTTLSLAEVGRFYGNRDHGTVIHACACVNNRFLQSPKDKEHIVYLRNLIISQLGPLR